MGDSSRMQSFKTQDLFSVEGKVALVTGGSRGIGLMIARGFVENGVKVYISSRKADVCEQVARELSKVGQCISIPADLGTSGGVATLVSEIGKKEEKLDILVNNAGATWGAPVEEYPEDGWDKVMNLNVKSIFMLTRALLPKLAKAGTHDDPARVINIGSIDGIKVPAMDNFAYSPSKAAVHHMTRVLAVHLAGRNITVNAIAPGPFESKMTAFFIDDLKQGIGGICPLNRIGKPSDIAGVALMLASNAGSYLTGVIIPVDGGITIK